MEEIAVGKCTQNCRPNLSSACVISSCSSRVWIEKAGDQKEPARCGPRFQLVLFSTKVPMILLAMDVFIGTGKYDRWPGWWRFLRGQYKCHSVNYCDQYSYATIRNFDAYSCTTHTIRYVHFTSTVCTLNIVVAHGWTRQNKKQGEKGRWCGRDNGQVLKKHIRVQLYIPTKRYQQLLFKIVSFVQSVLFFFGFKRRQNSYKILSEQVI